MAKAPTNKALAAELCKQFPDTANRSLARMLYDQNKERFTNLEAARFAIRFARGNSGDKNRKWKAEEVARPNGKAGWKPSCPPSSAEPWLPVQIDGPAKILSLSDQHVPYHDQGAFAAAVKYGRKLKPDVVLINGDFMDFHKISRWDSDPKSRDTAYEIEIGRHGLSWLRGQFPKARFIYKLGNHCERLDKYVYQKAPELFGVPALQLHNVLGFEEFGIERVNDNPILAGKLKVLHGHEAGKGMSSPVNPARGLFMRTLTSCLEGHYHRTSTHCEPDMDKSETTVWSQGCLCDMTPVYARINKWNWGFAFIDVASDNQFNVHNYRISNDYEVRTA